MNNNNNNTYFKISFTNKFIQNNFNKKFDYKCFLTKNHDSYKFRSSAYIETVKFTDRNLYKQGCFINDKKNLWIIYIPRIETLYNEDIMKNELYSNFFINLQKDIGTNNINDVYLVLTNLYESLPQYDIDKTLDFTFYQMLSGNNRIICNSINPDIYPTYYKLCKRISKPNCPNINDKNNLLFLSFLKNDDRQKYNYHLQKEIMENFAYLIIQKNFNVLVNRINLYYNDDDDNFLIVKEKLLNLINRCSIDDNSGFLYSNLAKIFYETISTLFINDDKMALFKLYDITKINIDQDSQSVFSLSSSLLSSSVE